VFYESVKINSLAGFKPGLVTIKTHIDRFVVQRVYIAGAIEFVYRHVSNTSFVR